MCALILFLEGIVCGEDAPELSVGEEHEGIGGLKKEQGCCAKTSNKLHGSRHTS